MRPAGSPGCLGRPGVLVEVGDHVLEQGVEDLVTVGEEAVQRGDGHPGAFGDGPGGRRVHTLGADDLLGGIEDLPDGAPAALLGGLPAGPGGRGGHLSLQYHTGPAASGRIGSCLGVSPRSGHCALRLARRTDFLGGSRNKL